MAECYALTSEPLPKALYGADSEYSIRLLSDSERLSIEDFFFAKGLKLPLDRNTTAIVVPQSELAGVGMADFAVLAEFGLGVLSLSGFQPVGIVAIFNASKCNDALLRSYSVATQAPTFPKRLVKSAAAAWFRCLFAARHKTHDKLHITADRFVRYLRTGNSRDGLVDLCICLESLLQVQSEISFRFSICLAKIADFNNPEITCDLLSALYDLRSKVVHGMDPSKEHHKITPNIAKLRTAARAILARYVLYMNEHSKEDWKKYLKSSLFA